MSRASQGMIPGAAHYTALGHGPNFSPPRLGMSQSGDGWGLDGWEKVRSQALSSTLTLRSQPGRAEAGREE